MTLLDDINIELNNAVKGFTEKNLITPGGTPISPVDIAGTGAMKGIRKVPLFGKELSNIIPELTLTQTPSMEQAKTAFIKSRAADRHQNFQLLRKAVENEGFDPTQGFGKTFVDQALRENLDQINQENEKQKQELLAAEKAQDPFNPAGAQTPEALAKREAFVTAKDTGNIAQLPNEKLKGLTPEEIRARIAAEKNRKFKRSAK